MASFSFGLLKFVYLKQKLKAGFGKRFSPVVGKLSRNTDLYFPLTRAPFSVMKQVKDCVVQTCFGVT